MDLGRGREEHPNSNDTATTGYNITSKYNVIFTAGLLSLLFFLSFLFLRPVLLRDDLEKDSKN